MGIRSRQDELIRLLRRSGATTVAGVAESLCVSRRTVLRDLGDLREQGFIIRADSGRGGGISLDPSSIHVSPKLSSAEVFALLVSVSVMRVTHSLPFADLAGRGLRKIEQALPRERVAELREVLESLYIGSSASEGLLNSVGHVDDSLLPAFEESFFGRRRMHFQYIDSEGKRTSREAEPHAILVLPPVWYLVGYDPAKEAFRHFRMDRIRKPAVLDQRFSRRPFTIDEGDCPFSFASKE